MRPHPRITATYEPEATVRAAIGEPADSGSASTGEPADSGSRPVSGALLVGTDGAAASDEALRFAVREARAHGLELVVVISYVGPLDPDVDPFEKPTVQWVVDARNLAETALARALGVDRSDLPPHRVLADDHEFTHLMRRAVHEEHDVRHIVLGQHHEHLLAHLLHGPSKAATLARRTHLPVTIVPTPLQEKEQPATP